MQLQMNQGVSLAEERVVALVLTSMRKTLLDQILHTHIPGLLGRDFCYTSKALYRSVPLLKLIFVDKSIIKCLKSAEVVW